jgi:hypothetical protein
VTKEEKDRADERGDAEEMMSSLVFTTEDGHVLYAGPLTTEADDPDEEQESIVGVATGEDYTPPSE